MDTTREKLLRIRQVINENEMLARYEFDPVVKQELIDFVDTNKDKLRELSLRMVLKLADLKRSFPLTWQMMARTTCMRRV